MKTSLYSLLLIALPIFMISCSKDGPTGPAGATGATGAAGPAGPAGPAGAAGAPGSANVIYSAWLDVPFLADTIHTTTAPFIDTIGFYADISALKLTNAILTSGEVKVYWNFNTAAQPVVFPLPYLDIYSTVSISPVFFLQTIELYSNANVSTRTIGADKVFQYRYVIIPGGTPARVMPDGKAVDWNNYASVQKYLGLTD